MDNVSLLGAEGLWTAERGSRRNEGPDPGDVDVSTCGRSDEATRPHVGDGERERREEEGHRTVPLLLSRVVPDRDGQVSVG